MGDSIKCTKCGAESKDRTWCDDCGAGLGAAQDRPIVDDSFVAKNNAGKSINLTIVEILESYSTHRTLLAKATESELESHPSGAFYRVEEKLADETRPFAIPDVVSGSFLKPIAATEDKQYVIEVYEKTPGITLAELVSNAEGHLNVKQIEEIFSAICDAVTTVNSLGYLVLAISPWTLRLMGCAVEKDFMTTNSEQVEVVHTREHEVDDSEVERLVAESDSPITRKTRPINFEESEVISGYKVMFEGIDFVVTVNDDPDEVPVIMGFSAPEFFGPYSRDVDVTCDVFALGMILYFLVSGRLPPSSAQSRHCPAFGAKSFREGFPPGLETVITKATHHDQDQRFQSAEEMKVALLKAAKKSQKRLRMAGEPIPRPMLTAAVETHVGISKRRRNPVNQDAVFQGVSNDGAFALFLVADGVSTASFGSGDLASGFLAREAENAWDELLPQYLLDAEFNPREILGNILEGANQRLVDYVNMNYPDFAGNPHEVMGSTALFALYYDGVLTTASLGDSRVYLHDELGMEQLTTDHNLWTLSIVEGVPTEAAMTIPHGDALARCVGTFQIKKEGLVAISPAPDFYQFVVFPGDTVLMTTDGLLDYSGPTHAESERRIRSILENGGIPDIQCLEFVLMANKGGGGDNIGVGILRFT